MHPNQIAAMLKEYDTGIASAKLAKKYFVHPQTIIRIAVNHGRKMPVERNKDLAEALKRKVQDLQAQGYTTTAIARRLGIGATKVIEYRTRDTGEHAAERNEQVKADRAAGLSYNAIARKRGISPHTAKRAIEGYKGKRK